MVKFGKEFRKYQIKQWKESYINYKALKQEIKAIRANIDNIKHQSGRIDNSGFSDLGHPSLKPMELVPEDDIALEVQDLNSLYNLKYGGELKRFIELLDKEFKKFNIHFVNQEKELYKRINGHCYCAEAYKDYNIVSVFNEINEIYVSLKLAKQLNCFINDNVMAIKKILKKFDKKYQKYFGVIGPKYISSHLTSQNSNLEYLLQFKLIDESTTICEYNLKILFTKYKALRENNPHNHLIEGNNNINLNQLDVNLKNLKEKIYDTLDDIDELTYFKIQYREWFYYAKQNQRIVKNNPTIYENDIYNPVLSSTYIKDSILEKCISFPLAVKEIEKSQSPLSHSNKTNLYLLYIYCFIYGSFITNIFPLIPNYFSNYIQKDLKTLYLLPIILTYTAELIPYSIFIKINYLDKNNTLMRFSFIISYLFICISSLILIYVTNNIEDKNTNLMLIMISRIILGISNNKMMNKKYITLYLPKFRLSYASKIFIISEMVGEICGPLISLLLIQIDNFNIGNLKYSEFNCIGWFGILISLFMGIVQLIFFTKPLSDNFLMVKDEKNISGNKYYQKSEDEINRKKYEKEQNLMYKKTFHNIRKKHRKSINENEDFDDNENLIIRTSIVSEDKEKDNNMKEKLIDTKNNEGSNSFENEGNSLDVSGGGNIALTVKQKKMINDIEKVLEKKNEECNFDDMNQIPKNINLIIKKEKETFGYINQNILFILIIFFISSLSKANLIFKYIYYIQEKIYEGTPDLNMFCLLIFLLFLPQICKIFFIFQFHQANYKFRIFIFASVLTLLIFNIALMIEVIYDYDFIYIILNILLLLGYNIINLCCSCYLSFIMLPDWKFLCMSIGPLINFSIICGEVCGGIISLFFSSNDYINQWIIMIITIIFFIYILILIFLTRTIRLKGITRIIRKNACETNQEN